MTDVARQHAEIDRLNARGPQCHLLKGIEANITPDGALDLSPRRRRAGSKWSSPLRTPNFDRSTIRRHGWCARSSTRTRTFWRTPAGAWPAPGPASSPIGTRSSAGRRKRASQWSSTAIRRGRISTTCWPLEALKAGCTFAIDSDAHGPRELPYAEYGAGARPSRQHSQGSNRELLEPRPVPPVAGGTDYAAAIGRRRVSEIDKRVTHRPTRGTRLPTPRTARKPHTHGSSLAVCLTGRT